MSKKLLRSVLAAAVLTTGGLVVAAEQTPADQAAAGISLPGYPAQGAPALVTVSSTGAQPRTALRYKLAAGTKETMLVATGIGISMVMEGMSMPAMELPTMKMTADLAVTSVTPAGDITYDMAYTDMTAEALPGTDPSVATMMQAAAGGIKALKGSFTVSDRGIIKSSTLNMDAITDPTLRQTLSAVSSSLQSLSMPLPAESVGVGAKWEVRQATKATGAVTFQRIECELVSVDAQAATIKMKMEQIVPPQAISNPAVPGVTMNVEKAAGAGEGTTTVRFGSLVPTSEMSSNIAMTMAMDLNGQTQRITADTRVKVSVGPKKN
jgi:hypothetical protein